MQRRLTGKKNPARCALWPEEAKPGFSPIGRPAAAAAVEQAAGLSVPGAPLAPVHPPDAGQQNRQQAQRPGVVDGGGNARSVTRFGGAGRCAGAATALTATRSAGPCAVTGGQCHNRSIRQRAGLVHRQGDHGSFTGGGPHRPCVHGRTRGANLRAGGKCRDQQAQGGTYGQRRRPTLWSGPAGRQGLRKSACAGHGQQRGGRQGAGAGWQFGVR